MPGLAAKPRWAIEAGQFGDPNEGGSLSSEGLVTLGSVFGLAFTSIGEPSEIVLIKAATGAVVQRIKVPVGTRVRSDRIDGRPVLIAEHESPQTEKIDRWIFDEKGTVTHRNDPIKDGFAGGYFVSGENVNPALHNYASPIVVRDLDGQSIIKATPRDGVGSYSIFDNLAVLDYTSVIDLQAHGHRVASLQSPGRQSLLPTGIHGLYDGKLLKTWQIAYDRKKNRPNTRFALYKPRTGRLLWSKDVPGFETLDDRDIIYEPHTGRLILNDSTAHHQIALDLTTGRTIWTGDGPGNFGLALPGTYYQSTGPWQPLIPIREIDQYSYLAARIPSGDIAAEHLKTAPAAISSDGFALVRNSTGLYGFPLTF